MLLLTLTILYSDLVVPKCLFKVLNKNIYNNIAVSLVIYCLDGFKWDTVRAPKNCLPLKEFRHAMSGVKR